MKDLLAFILQYYGILCGNTPENKGQCVGLISLWQDRLGISHEWGDAKDLLANADTSKFDVIYNDVNNPNQFPLPGDVLVYGSTWGGGVGHTGVVLIADGNSIILFEQNNPGAPIIKREPYNGLLGWLHLKGFNVDQQAVIDELRIARDQHYNDLQAEIQKNKDLTIQLADCKAGTPPSTVPIQPPAQVEGQNQAILTLKKALLDIKEVLGSGYYFFYQKKINKIRQILLQNGV